MLSQAQKQLFKEVVKEARQHFVSGLDIASQIGAQKRNIPGFADLFRNSYSWPQYNDVNFPHYNANTIYGTNFVAANGPATTLDVANLLDHTLFHHRTPITRIIALGDTLGTDTSTLHDFYDYFSGDNIRTTFGNYEISVVRTHGDTEKGEDDMQIFPKGIIQSTVTVKRMSGETTEVRQLNVTLLPVNDNSRIFLDKADANHPIAETSPQKRREILWELFLATQKEITVVHCAAGVGRTGHLILMFEIMKHCSRLIELSDPKKIAHEILGILEHIRQNRPCLVINEAQFVYAIRNAFSLHQYQLENIKEQERRNTLSYQIAAFFVIYKAIRAGQSSWALLLDHDFLQHCPPNEKVDVLENRITLHNRFFPEGRAAKAWALAQEHFKKCHENNSVLEKQIFRAAHQHSSLFSATNSDAEIDADFEHADNEARRRAIRDALRSGLIR